MAFCKAIDIAVAKFAIKREDKEQGKAIRRASQRGQAQAER